MRALRIAFGLAVVAAAGSACGDDFEPSAAGGSAGDDGGAGDGSGGGAGSAGGGAAGSGGSPACSDDGDCDDGAACNGKETCAGGSCQPGTSVNCNNPDAATCTATCEEPGGTCVVTANDADGDQHKANCPADPGDDCDDADPTSYPGAAEVCDGNDNNCNGYDDLQAGFGIGGTTKKIVGVVGADLYDPEVAWCPGGSKFVMVWTDTREGSPRIFGASLAPNGVLGVQKKISTTVAGTAIEPRIACAGSECAVVWYQTATPIDVFLQRVDCDATPVGAAVNVSETPGAANVSPSVSRLGSDWIVGLIEKDATGMPAAYRVIASDGTPKTSTQVVSAPTGLRTEMASAATSSHVGFVWGLAGIVEWARIDASLNASTYQALTPSPAPSGVSSKDAHIAAHLGNFAMAWSTTTTTESAVEYVERATDGNVVCSIPVLTTAAETHVLGIASHEKASLAAILRGAANIFDVSLAVVRNGCTVLDEIALNRAR